MTSIKKFLLSILLCFSLITLSSPKQIISAKTDSSIAFIVLTKYKATIDIGNEFYIIAVTSSGKLPTWKSSDSKIASVNTYGKVIAKKPGTVTITAKIKNAEASCQVSINETKVSISTKSVSMERNDTIKLTATTSNNSKVTWKSSKKTVAIIDENGTVTGMKPGETSITATADKTSATCIVTVRPPTITLNKTKITLYRGQTAKLSAAVSSRANPTWKSNKSSVAFVDETGTITAIKHGIAIIKATVDGVLSTCEVLVQQPTITLSSTDISLKSGNKVNITATISSGNAPIWSTSNANVVTVSQKGTITGVKKGKAYIYAAEDGVKIRCTIYVTD